MADQCLDPSNSTDCLLRAILAANSGYNWNPVTFGFTAVFTIIAFVVSVVALFQQFIAAGPGRLKASQRAIGPQQNRQRANTRFSWREFRFQTVVKVPVIDVQKVIEHRTTTIDVEDEHDLLTSKTNKRQRVLSSDEASRVVAGWSQLLHDLSLADVDFDTLQCLTDYLPDDVPAAPAWGRVESIVFLCVMKGCTRLAENADGYIGAIGQFAQLSWNMHPTLGPMAVYRTWDIQQTGRHGLHDVQKMIPIFLGELFLTGNSFYKPLAPKFGQIPVSLRFMQVKKLSAPSWELCRHEHDHCTMRRDGLWLGYMMASASRDGGVDKQSAALAALLFADRPATTKAFPTRVAETHSALKTMYTEYFPWLILADDLDDNVLRLLCETFIEFDESDALVGGNSCNASSVLTSWLPYVAQNGSSKPDASDPIERPVVRRPDPVPTRMFGKTAPEGPSIEKITASGLRIARPAVRYLSKWLSDETSLATANAQERRHVQLWLTYQLTEVDWFLSTMGNDLICAAANLIALGTAKFGAIQFTKLSRRFVMPETLDAFHLDWTKSMTDPGSLIVKGYLDQETIQQLFAYTKNYVDKHRSELRTVKCATTAQGFYFTTKKHHKYKHEHYPDKSDTVSEGLVQSTTNDSSTTRPIMEWATEKTSAEPISRQLTDNMLTSADMPKSDDTLTQPVPGTNPAPDQKLGPRLYAHVDDSEMREYLSEEAARRASEGDSTSEAGVDEVPVKIDPLVGALEALVFFRAGLLGAMLANGTDTSLILTSDKRYQLVQVE